MSNVNEPNYIVPLENVKEVRETTDIEELNSLIKSGWMLLFAAASNHITKYSLGKI